MSKSKRRRKIGAPRLNQRFLSHRDRQPVLDPCQLYAGDGNLPTVLRRFEIGSNLRHLTADTKVGKLDGLDLGSDFPWDWPSSSRLEL